MTLSSLLSGISTPTIPFRHPALTSLARLLMSDFYYLISWKSFICYLAYAISALRSAGVVSMTLGWLSWAYEFDGLVRFETDSYIAFSYPAMRSSDIISFVMLWRLFGYAVLEASWKFLLFIAYFDYMSGSGRPVTSARWSVSGLNMFFGTCEHFSCAWFLVIPRNETEGRIADMFE